MLSLLFSATVVLGLGDPTKTIVENAVATPILSTLVSVLSLPDYASLLTALSSPGNYTVFAPNDKAFAAAGLDVTEVEKVTAIIEYHVLGTKVLSTDLKSQQFPHSIMADPSYVELGGQGQVLDVAKSGDGVWVYFGAGSAKVILADVLCSNGVVHVVDSVIMLPLSTPDTAVASKLNTLAKALTKAGLLDAIDTTPSITVFAPTDAAFEALGDLDKIPLDTLTAVLKYHVVPAVAYSVDVANGTVPTLLGKNLNITVGTDIKINGDTEVIALDILTKNGVVHVINKVLIPPK